MKDLNYYQEYFDTNIVELAKMDEDDIEYLEQNHFGDLLIEETEYKKERFKLWRNLDCNISEGEPLIQIEYCGKNNGYVWETVFEITDKYDENLQ